MITKPTISCGWMDNYISQVQDENLLEGFKKQTEKTLALISSLTEEQLDYRYAEGKWNIREIMVHLMDTERVFGYRALRFARNDKTELAGYDENEFAANSFAADRPLKGLLEEYIVVRTCTLALFSNFAPEVIHRTGKANNTVMSVAGLGFSTLGHEIHHMRIIRERYISHSGIPVNKSLV